MADTHEVVAGWWRCQVWVGAIVALMRKGAGSRLGSVQ